MGEQPTIYALELPETYHRTGFFNVPVAFDRLVRLTPGEITIHVKPEEHSFEATVNRSANTNGTARIMGGVPLRDWFQLHARIGQTVFVSFDALTEMTLSMHPPNGP